MRDNVSKEKLEAVLADLREVCRKHGVLMDPCCLGEGITGDLCIYEDAGDTIDAGHGDHPSEIDEQESRITGIIRSPEHEGKWRAA
jgi:hypothetical protein